MVNHLYLIAFLFSWSCAAVVKQADLFDVQIVHFNDFHARFEETSTTSTKCVPENGECIGGFARLYTAINDLKTKNPNAVVLNAGDSFQGTLWYNLLRWNVTQYFMNMLPLDAHAIGNHEFDHGIAGIVPYLKALKAPVLVNNIDDSLEPDIQGLYNKSIIIERNGRKIGIIGVIAEDTDLLSTTEDLKFNDPVEAVRIEAEKLTNLNVSIIIVLSHCGLDVDRIIARNAGPNIDIIVGGHSHSLLYTGTPPNGIAEDVYPVVVIRPTNSKVLIVQASAYTKYIADITLSFDSYGQLVDWKGQPTYLDKNIKQDENMINLMKPFKEQVDLIGKKEIGGSNVYLSRSSCSKSDCNVGNMITDSYVESVINIAENGSWTYAAISIINQGGIRTDINKGSITYEDLAISQPFGNTLFTFDLKGKYLLETLEYSVSGSENGSSFHMIQQSGMQIVFNFTKPVGQKVEKVLVLCEKCNVPSYSPLELEKDYKLVVPSFVANGGDGFVALSDNKKNVKIRGIDIDAVESYVKKHSPLINSQDNRIVVVK